MLSAAYAVNGLNVEPRLYWPWMARLVSVDVSGSSLAGDRVDHGREDLFELAVAEVGLEPAVVERRVARHRHDLTVLVVLHDHRARPGP